VPTQPLAWSVTFANTTQGSVSVGPDATRALSPESYAAVTVQSRVVLKLRTGVCYFDSLTFEPQATLQLDQTAGRVTIYVKSVLTFRGDLRSSTGAMPALFVGYFGTGTALLESAFTGTVVAPNGTIRLGTTSAGHNGVFFGKRVTVDANTRVTYLASVGVGQ
jgi:hypothetical protein